METQLFNWDGWDDMGEGSYMFYNCQLKEEIGPFKPGTQFKDIYMDYQKGYVQLDGRAFKLSLKVGEEFQV